MVDEVLPTLNQRPTRIGAAITDLITSTESHARSIAKAASWRMTGSLDTFIIATFVTGSPKAGGAVALTEILTKTILYYFHERAWVLIPWGKRPNNREKTPVFDQSRVNQKTSQSKVSGLRSFVSALNITQACTR